jgi:hypothetical protein
MMGSRTWYGILVLMPLLLSACAPAAGGPAVGSASVRAWFDAPLPGTVFYPPNPCQIVAHGSSPSGIALFELTINGGAASLIPSPDTASSLPTLSRDCGLSQPGEYNLLLRVQDNAGAWSGYAETSLIIAGAEVPPVAPPVIGPAPTDTPTPTPTPAPIGGVTIESISSSLIYAGEGSCGPLELTITARATAPQGIQVVVLFYRFEPGSPSGFHEIAMNPIGGDLYQATINPTSVLGGPIPAEYGTVNYQVVVQQPDGDTSIRTPVLYDVGIERCGAAPVECSSYPDKRACERNGCSWVEVPAIISSFVCRDP